MVEGEDELAFTVSTVWREERVSCPHPDIVRSYLAGALPKGAVDFVDFHLRESCCPYCNAVLDELRASDAEAGSRRLEDLRDRLLRSTVAALRNAGGERG